MGGGWGEGGSSEVDLLNLYIMDYSLKTLLSEGKICVLAFNKNYMSDGIQHYFQDRHNAKYF